MDLGCLKRGEEHLKLRRMMCDLMENECMNE